MLVNLEALKEDVKILFEAIEEGAYGTRCHSIVGDVYKLMGAHIRQLEKEVGHLTPNAVEAQKPCASCKTWQELKANYCQECGLKLRPTD